MSQVAKTKKAYVLPIIAGVLIVLNAVLLCAAATWFPQIIPTIPGTSNDAVPFTTLTAVGLLCGALVLIGALLLVNKPNSRKVWGIMIIAFSIPTVIMGGGFIVGFIIGIVGGVKAVRAGRQSQCDD